MQRPLEVEGGIASGGGGGRVQRPLEVEVGIASGGG